MNIKLSSRVQAVKPSPTLAITARAAALRAAGEDVIGLGAGEPDFDTPEHIKNAAKKAMDEGKTKYTPVDGTASLKQAVIDKFRRDNGFEYTPEQILVSSGGKQSFFNMAQALLDPGDEVIIPAPYWVSYPDMVILAGAAPYWCMPVQTSSSRSRPHSWKPLSPTIPGCSSSTVLPTPRAWPTHGRTGSPGRSPA